MTYYLVGLLYLSETAGDLYSDFPTTPKALKAKFNHSSRIKDRLKSYSESYETVHDNMWYVIPGNRKVQHTEVFYCYHGLVCSERLLKILECHAAGLYKAVQINIVNRKQKNLVSGNYYYLLPNDESADVVNFAIIKEDGIYHENILGPTKFRIEDSKTKIVRSPKISFKENAPSLFQLCLGNCEYLFFDEQIKLECDEQNISGLTFECEEELIVVDFQPDGDGGIIRGEDIGRNYTGFQTKRSRAAQKIVSDQTLSPSWKKAIADYKKSKGTDSSS